jgi:hypothetical protein
VYSITERGERYLDGELDTSEDAPDDVDAAEPNGGTDLEEPGSLS